MSKSTPARRQPARTATPEDIADGNGAARPTIDELVAKVVEKNRDPLEPLKELVDRLDTPRPRAASPEGDAPAPDENGDRIPPKPEPELARKVDWILGYDCLVDPLAKGEWIPSTPEAVGAALRLLAEEAVGVFHRAEHQQDTLEQITTHLTAAGKAASNA